MGGARRFIRSTSEKQPQVLRLASLAQDDRARITLSLTEQELRVQLIAFLAVLAEIEALGFFGGGDAQTHGFIDQEQ